MNNPVAVTTWPVPTKPETTALACCAALAEAVLAAPEASLRPDQAAVVPTALRAIETLTIPAPAELMAIECARMAEWLTMFGIPAKADPLSEAYDETLAHLPPDLLEEAFRRIKAVHKWPHRPPFPAEIAATVSEEYRRRRRIRMGLRLLSRLPVEAPVTPVSRAEGMAGYGQVLTALQRLPTHEEDLAA